MMLGDPFDWPGPSGETYVLFLSEYWAGHNHGHEPMAKYYEAYPYMRGWL